MTVDFQDRQRNIVHSLFQDWRRAHPQGFFLAFTANRRARMHAALCPHSGDTDWTFEASGGSLTKKRKVCDESEEALLAWAAQEGVEVSRCADCLGRKPADRPAPPSARPADVPVEAVAQPVEDVRPPLPSTEDRDNTPPATLAAPEPLTAFTWGYWGWGTAVPQFLGMAAAAEAARGFEPPVFADVRLRRSVRAPGFDGRAFENAVGPDRYRWFSGLGNTRIATGEPGVEIAKPEDAELLLDFIMAQAAVNRRVLFFCACPVVQNAPCHRHTVAQRLLLAAAARSVALTVIEWPGGDPDTRELTLRASRTKWTKRAPIRLGTTLPESGLATLPWGSRLRVRVGPNIHWSLTGPASFKKQWVLPVLGTADADDPTGARLEQKGVEFRRRYLCNARHS